METATWEQQVYSIYSKVITSSYNLKQPEIFE